MPSETMDLKSLSSSLYSFEDIFSSTTKKHAGLWKSDNLSNCYGSDRGTGPNTNEQTVSNFSESSEVDVIATRHESSFFSSSLSELFSRKLRLSANSALYGHSVDTVASQYEEEMPFGSLEELEAQTIGNLLPNDDDDDDGDSGSGLIGVHDHTIQDSAGDDTDELDLFTSVGGMDLGDDDSSSSGEKNSKFLDGACNGQVEFDPYGEHRSRTLVVRNITSNVQDSELKAIFEQFGDIHTLYTACKQCGFVLISYYDIRAAQNAMRAHQNGLFSFRKFDIHYSIPTDNVSRKNINQGSLAVFLYDSSVSNNELHRLFSVYGEIKEIRENRQSQHHKLVEFYDVRAADAALRALNRNDISWKWLKVEPSRHGDSKSMFQHIHTPSVETSFRHGVSSTVPNTLPALIRVKPVSNQCGITGSSSPRELNSGIQAASTFNPRSLPEYHDGLANVLCSPPELAANVNSLPVHHNQWSNSYQTLGMKWPNSPPYFDGICAASSVPRLHSFSMSPSHMMSTVIPVNNQHVPPSAVNCNIWNSQRTYSWESPEASVFHPGSIGHDQFSSNDVFPHFGGGYVDPRVLPKNVGLGFHNQRAVMFPGRNCMIPVMNSFETHKGRPRSRRNEGGLNLADTKQYELDIIRIKNGEDNRTTLMLKNIPNKYTSKMLLDVIDERHKGTYDFVYLPIDFKNKCNVGYAFINMINPSLIIPFYQVFDGKKWEKFHSEKVASLAYARIQGKAALIAHFQNSSLMNVDKRCRPILFNTDGPNAGDEVPFPVGVNVRNKSGRSRNIAPEEDKIQVIQPNSGTGDCISKAA